jgi:Ca2+-binding EF-hand superfamily protein
VRRSLSGMADNIDQFRAILRSSATEASKSLPQFISGLFEFVEAPEESSKMLTFENFEKGICVVKDIRRNMKRTELAEIFEECDDNGTSKVSLDVLIDFCERSLSRARILALKLRKAIRESCQDTDHYIQAFASISGGTKFADPDSFRDFAEDMLSGVIKDSDSLALYGLFDTNGDGKVSLDDFLGFIQPFIPDASRVLERINPECVIDVKISPNKTHDAELVRQGYQQITPGISRGKEIDGNTRVDEVIAAQGTFGKGQSLWIWKAKQGTCGGKLRPIIDIQLEASSSSTALIISGYICLPIPISGQWVWLKRAATVQEEFDSIVDFQVRSLHPQINIL